MIFKSIIIACLISVSFAGLLPSPQARSYEYPAPDHQHQHWKPKPEEHWEPANYEFQYEVHNVETGDIKRQQEKAENGKITGQYSLVEPDGLHRRVVEYTADDEHGFIAVVRLEPWKEASHKPHQPSPAYPPPVHEPSNHYIPPSNHYVPPARRW